MIVVLAGCYLSRAALCSLLAVQRVLRSHSGIHALVGIRRLTGIRVYAGIRCCAGIRYFAGIHFFVGVHWCVHLLNAGIRVMGIRVLGRIPVWYSSSRLPGILRGPLLASECPPTDLLRSNSLRCRPHAVPRCHVLLVELFLFEFYL